MKLWIWITFGIIGAILVILFFLGGTQEEQTNLNELQNDSLESNYVLLKFMDNKTSCPIIGEVYLGNNSIGISNEEGFNLSRDDYDSYWVKEISIKGRSDSCFGGDSNLPIVMYWGVDDLEYYFYNYEPVLFEEKFDLRSPYYTKSMQGFIRPDEVAERFSRIRIDENNSKIENIEKILQYTYMNWVSDKGKFGQADYWQTPLEFIINKQGDCEDWAIYFVSLLRKYDQNLNCYAALWDSHMNVICQVNKTFLILDQEKIEKKLILKEDLSIQENKIKIREWENNYFSEYGISPEGRKLFALFNEEEMVIFENGQEDFIDWVIENGLTL